MKNKFKGFTLIECLVALAILGIASLTMAQIYGAVARNNKTNHLVNTSLSNQMAYVEKHMDDSERVSIYYGGGSTSVKDPALNDAAKKPPHVADTAESSTKPRVKIYGSYVNKDTGTTTDIDMAYSYSADIYVLKSRDRDNVNLESSTRNAGYTEDDYNLRYKYILGHSNG